MARIHEDITKTVERTSLIRLNRVMLGLPATVLAKVESFNQLGSVKDRARYDEYRAAPPGRVDSSLA